MRHIRWELLVAICHRVALWRMMLRETQQEHAMKRYMAKKGEPVTLRISYDMQGVDWYAVGEVFRLAPLGRREPQQFQQACAQSAVVVFAYDDDTLIGVGRALSDGEYYAGIYDVAILPAFQGQGVGTHIVLALLEKLPVGTVTVLDTEEEVLKVRSGKRFR